MEASLLEDEALAGVTDMVTRFAAERLTLERRRELVGTADGFSRGDWQEMAELGWQALPLAVSCGGLGGGAQGAAIVMEAAGRGLMLEPYLPSVILAGSLLEHCLDEDRRDDLIAGIASGERIFAVAHHDGANGVSAVADGNGWRLRGEKVLVLGGDVADQLLVPARTDEGQAIFLVDATAANLAAARVELLDGRRAADLQLDGVSAQILPMADPAAAVERSWDLGTIAICCEALGAMTGLNQATLDYVKTRKQFGCTIGSFQVLQHRLVDMHVIEQETRAIVRAAVAAYDQGHPGLPLIVSAAKARLNEAAQFIGESAVQSHGGIGMTDELIVGHYFKRLMTIRALFGNSDHHCDRVTRLTAAFAQ